MATGRGLAKVGAKSLGIFRKLGVDKLFRRVPDRPPGMQRAIDDAMQVGTRSELEIAAKNRLAERLQRIASAGRRGENPLDHVPEGAERRVLHPIQGKAQYGVEYKWREAGVTIRVRAHGPDPSAPPGTNAHGGEVYRVQQGKRYMDADGTLHRPNIENPQSPNYDEQAVNDTHIPWPGQHNLPRS